MSMKKYYKYKSLKNLDHVLDILTNARLYCSEYGSLNDPAEGEFQAKILLSIESGKYLNKDNITTFYTRGNWSDQIDPEFKEFISSLQKKYLICSLSKTFKSIPLWAYYAESFSGICIEVVPKNELEFTDVTYNSDYPTCLFDPKEISAKSSEESIDRQIRKSLTYKGSHWKVEKEVRLLWREKYFDNINPIKRVYCGSRIDKNHFDLFRKLFPDIEFIQTRISNSSPKIITINQHS